MKDLNQEWADIRERRKAEARSGRITLTERGTQLHLVAPYREGLPSQIRAIGGKWRYRSQVWSIPAKNKPQLLRLLSYFYGWKENENGEGN